MRGIGRCCTTLREVNPIWIVGKTAANSVGIPLKLSGKSTDRETHFLRARSTEYQWVAKTCIFHAYDVFRVIQGSGVDTENQWVSHCCQVATLLNSIR